MMRRVIARSLDRLIERSIDRVIERSRFVRLPGTAALRCAKIRNCFALAYVVLRATLREIFDESAYDRFLARTRLERSAISYRAFMREREDAMAHKQRCC